MHALPILQKEGWQIEIADDYTYQVLQSPIDEWYSSIEENACYDWFGLELGIKIKNEKINLLPVLQQLLPKIQANNQINIPESEFFLAKLPDGRYIQLPADRVRHILNVLIELYDSDLKRQKNSKEHCALIN